MASRVKVRMSSRGASEILNSPEVLADLERRANAIKEAADGTTDRKSGFRNENYYMRSGTGTSRARASVIAANPYSISQNRKYNILLKCMDAGRN